MNAASFLALSGLGTKGPACFLVEASGRRLILDLGYGPDPDAWPDLAGVGPVDALLLSHGHRDHAGALALRARIGNPPVWATASVLRRLPPGLPTHPLPLHGAADVLGIAVQTGRDGHAPGGVWLHLGVGEGLLYTGDFSSESPIYAFDPPPPAPTLVLDASYGDDDRPFVAGQAELLAVLAALAGRPVLLPAPEAGRGPEIALALAEAESGAGPLRLGEAMRRALETLAGPDRPSLRNGVAERLATLARTALPLPAPGQPPAGAMLTGSADCAAGESAALLAGWTDTARPRAALPEIVFTGYLPPGTPAARLVAAGHGRLLRWNAHPRLSEIRALVRACGARAVVPAFCPAHPGLGRLPAALAPARVIVPPERLTL